MEAEVESRVKLLTYKVKAMSRESPSQKATNLLDTDLRNHWSTGTNTKEWILLELGEPCLLSHLRVYNKSVLEWEISVGLRYKPETFSKVRPRCEAPRHDITYPMNYSPCRYVRISCLRGNPIALFFVQLMGIPVPCLEPEFQTIANHLIPQISSSKQDTSDLHLQLLKDLTSRLSRFVPQLEAELNCSPEAAEPTLRFLAMLAGPFFPILHMTMERETTRLALSVSENDASKNSPPSTTTLMVSSNFEPRRSRHVPSGVVPVPAPMQLVFRTDIVLSLLRKAYKDLYLGKVCRMASRILLKLVASMTVKEVSAVASGMPPSVSDDPISIPDYSSLFGDEFQVADDFWDSTYLNVLDSDLVEEGILHVLYGCATQPVHCRKLAENSSHFWLVLPLIQALLPALRPNISSPYHIDDNFSLWKQLFVQKALSQVVATSSSIFCRPLLHACAGYLASFSQSHAKTACVLIDLCSGVLSPWMAQVTAKVDLAMELLEDLLAVIQGAQSSISRAHAALKYIVLALSGNMDDVMSLYKDAKHRILFLLEMLGPYLDPSFTPMKGSIAFGNVSSLYTEQQEKNCGKALNIIRTAIRKPGMLPSLEAAWRHESVAPSVLLSVLDCQMQFPADIDNCKFSGSESGEQKSAAALPPNDLISSKLDKQDISDVKTGVADANGKIDVAEDFIILFAPADLSGVRLTHNSTTTETKSSGPSPLPVNAVINNADQQNMIDQFPEYLETVPGIRLCNIFADYHHIMNFRDCELKASEFRRLAHHLELQGNTPESHDVAVNALLLAAECYISPSFMMSLENVSPVEKVSRKFANWVCVPANIERNFIKDVDLKLVADIERTRDRIVLDILIEAAELDRQHGKLTFEENFDLHTEENVSFLPLSKDDILSADAISLIRQNQVLLFNFLMHCLQKGFHEEEHSVKEILMWCLLFLLHSATKLFFPAELVVDVILNFAKSLNLKLKSSYYELDRGDSQFKKLKVLEMQRCWILLHQLVVASSGSEEKSTLFIGPGKGFRFVNLVPASAWLQKVPLFSSSAFPLVRYFGWMAVSRISKQFLVERLFLVSDLTQLTHLLSVFWDDLALLGNIAKKKGADKPIEDLNLGQAFDIVDESSHSNHADGVQSFHVFFPDIYRFFPDLSKEFVGFSETILEAVGLQLKILSSSIIPDLMSWLSDLCTYPFVQNDIQQNAEHCKGFVSKNAKAVILYVIESIVVEHMEAMVPEVPRVVQVLASLCKSAYCDASFLESVLCFLKPIVTYSTNKVSSKELPGNTLLADFESLCFSDLFNDIKICDETTAAPLVKELKAKSLLIYALASILDDLSFKRKMELLESSIFWADFTSSRDSSSFQDYICAYKVLMENCRSLLISTSRSLGVVPIGTSSHSDTDFCTNEDFSELQSSFLCYICNVVSPSNTTENQKNNSTFTDALGKVQLNAEEAVSFSKPLEALLLKLCPSLEQCWKLHPKLSKMLVLTCAESFIHSRCLCLFTQNGLENLADVPPSGFVNSPRDLWRASIEGLSKMILDILGKKCWQVVSVLLEAFLSVPKCIRLENVIDDICLAIKKFSNSAPSMYWRLETDRMLSSLLARGIHNICHDSVALVDLFSVLLGHPEPEQRYVALKNLRSLVVPNGDDAKSCLSSTAMSLIASDSVVAASEPILSSLISATWDRVALVASNDMSLHLRTHAMALLISFIPFVERTILQSFLASADSILHCLVTPAEATLYSPLTQFSLALIASVCLYSSPDDISLIPESIWTNIEALGASKNDQCYTPLKKKACEALLRLRNNEEQAKLLLKEVFSSSSEKLQNPDFAATRESILQAIGNLTSAKSYFDFFSKEADEKMRELEEAEIEMELLQKEHLLQDLSTSFHELSQLPIFSTSEKVDHRLQKIKDEIKSIEKAKIRENVIARRQQKLLLRGARQKYLEEAALREAELLQKLDSERANEVEKELERRGQLEIERAKTRELQDNLEMEKEKQAQRDIQRELEQLESGIRPSRRDFVTSTQSRARDKYRERESSRDGSEVTLRSSGNRPFSGQVPTILQARERSDEGSGSFEETFDVGKDSIETVSIGDPDNISLEGQPPRQGSRGGKPRQIIERRERESRREGKWERKH